jgi:hypothetical protein
MNKFYFTGAQKRFFLSRLHSIYIKPSIIKTLFGYKNEVVKEDDAIFERALQIS